jgi:ABC-type branched-subunit amino acid transport system ATPase component
MLTSVYFVAILSGIGAIQLAQEPDGVLALAGQRRLAKQRERRRTSIEPAGAVRTRAVDRPPAAVERGPGRPDEAAFAMTGIVAGYGDVEVLHGVDLRLPAGEVVALLGANGAGKSTLCAVAAGIVEPTAGRVSFRGHDITDAPSFERTRQGVLLVPEARGVFPGLTVEENLAVLLRDEAHREQALLRFPVLAQRRRQIAGLLSGGEQQMLSLAPALVDPPAVLLADEPTLGLAPLAAAVVLDAIEELRALGCAVLLVEEHSHHALQVADTVVCMERGRVVWTGPRGEANLDLVAGAYLGSATTRQVPTRTP